MFDALTKEELIACLRSCCTGIEEAKMVYQVLRDRADSLMEKCREAQVKEEDAQACLDAFLQTCEKQEFSNGKIQYTFPRGRLKEYNELAAAVKKAHSVVWDLQEEQFQAFMEAANAADDIVRECEKIFA